MAIWPATMLCWRSRRRFRARCDTVGRVGGEEFGVILMGANASEAEIVAERIRREVEKLVFQPSDDERVVLTVSIGGVRCNPDAAVVDLMRAADRKLYDAKNGGRNLVVLEHSEAAA